MKEEERLQNEKVKRYYFEILKETKGFSDKTIYAIEKAIWRYEDFTNHISFKKFNSKIAKDFKKWLKEYKNSKTLKTLSESTQYHSIRHIQQFFIWLSMQNGYKSKVNINDIEYLNLDKKTVRLATQSRSPEYPTLEQIEKVCSSIEVKNDIDKRDRALIAFTALSAMRDQAIVTLPIGCFKHRTLEVIQDPSLGVETKFTKLIESRLFSFSDKLKNYILDWRNYLVKELLFSNSEPLFPKTKVEQTSEDNFGYEVKGVAKEYWKNAGPMRKIFKKRFEDAGIKYYPPHRLRHFAINHAAQFVRNAEEMKAISQNVGHEDIGTTFGSYGFIPPRKVSTLIGSMNFSDSDMNGFTEEELQKLKRVLNSVSD